MMNFHRLQNEEIFYIFVRWIRIKIIISLGLNNIIFVL